ncbi:acid-sensing ion channel 2-like isoform X4 [Artemia franciscana]|uniref:acid-sensing ion channel 2-like isoform X4 n=1 Tax=Artemia franciscana TaxID=6661 RepID=UPI0032DB117A
MNNKNNLSLKGWKRVKCKVDVVREAKNGVKKEPEFYFSLPGSACIFSSDVNQWRKLLWIALILCAGFLSTAQIIERISYFISTPLARSATVHLAEKIEFPILTLCSKRSWNYTRFLLEMPILLKKLNKTTTDIQLPYDFLALTNLEDLWSGYGINLKSDLIECYMGRNRSCEDSGSWARVYTVFGSCFSYETDEPLLETGPFNNFYGKFRIKKKDLEAEIPNGLKNPLATASVGWTYLLHNEHFTPALKARFGQDLSPGLNQDSEASKIVVTGTNVWHKPCVEPATDPKYSVSKCELGCFTEHHFRLSNVGTEKWCRLPFMTEDEGQCKCMPRCEETLYGNNAETVVGKRNTESRLRLFYASKSYESVLEKLAYKGVPLFCDIGNSMGLLIGASTLTLIEIIEWAAWSLSNLVKNIKRRIYHGKIRADN